MKVIHKTSSISIFNKTFDEDFQRAVFQEVLEKRKIFDPEWRAILQQCLDNLPEQIKGFRRNSEALARQLLPLCVKYTRLEDEAACAFLACLLDSWVQVNEAAVQVFEFLTQHPLQLPPHDPRVDSLAFVTRARDFEALRQKIVGRYSGIDANSVRLALMLRLQVAPISDQEYERLLENHPELSMETMMKWHDWIELARALPAEDPTWDTIPQFIQAIEALTQEKLAARPRHRQALQEAILRLQNRGTEYLAYFHAQQVTTWRSEVLSEAQAEPLIQKVEELHQAMDAYLTLVQTRPSNIQESRENRKRLQAYETFIIEALDSLNAIFSALLPPTSEPPSAEQSSESKSPLAEAASDTTDAQTESPAEAPPTDEYSEPTVSHEAEMPVAPESSIPPSESATEEAEAPAVHPVSITPAELDPSSVLDIRRAAQYYLENPSVESAKPLFWNMIAYGDWSGAYGVAQALEQAQIDPELPADFCAILAATSAMSSSTLTLNMNITSLLQALDFSERSPHKWLYVGLALKGTLVAPEAGLNDWLRTPEQLHNLHGLILAVAEFNRYGVPLDPMLLGWAENQDQRQQEKQQLVEEARILMKELPSRTMNFQAATQVWRLFMRDSGLRDLLTIVAEDREKDLARATELVSHWQDKAKIDSEIRAADRKLRDKRPEIIASSREQLHHAVGQIVKLARKWTQHYQRESQIKEKDEWLVRLTNNLRHNVQQHLSSIYVDLTAYMGEADSLSTRACAYGLARQLADFFSLLKIPLRDWEGFIRRHPWEVEYTEEMSLEAYLASRWYWAAPLPLDDVGRPAADVDHSMRLRALAQQWATEQASELVEAWMTYGDYRFIGHIIKALPSNERESLELRVRESLGDARYKLRGKTDSVMVDIERAFIDGLIDETQRTEYISKHQNSKDESIDNIRSEWLRLDGLAKDLQEARQYRLGHLQERWNSLKHEALRDVEEALRTEYVARIQAAFDRGDTRVIEEYLDAIQRSSSFTTPGLGRADFFAEFWDNHEKLEDDLGRRGTIPNGGLRNLLEQIDKRANFAGFGLRNVSSQIQQRLSKVIQSWRRLKEGEARLAENELFVHAASVLTFLQFSMRSTPPKIVRRDNDTCHLSMNMQTSEDLVRPIPQFGSQMRGLGEVLMVWERPTADTLTAYISGLKIDSKSMIVFYLGRLSRQRRLQIMRHIRQKEMAALVVDEVLLAYIMLKTLQQEQNPLPTLMQCALPFASVQPYTPGRAGDVPPEMFFGREKVVKQLQDSETCIIYGGRQLGKSALMRHVQRRFHVPDQEQYAHVEDIKLIGGQDTQYGTEMIWQRLRDCFKEMGLLPKTISTERSADIVKYLEEALRSRPRARVIVMFDEADNFLGADADKNFPVVDQLRNLMNRTERRFKVIFAGLHNVQRFQGIPNQPLAHFGRPVVVGPLEPADALRLVQEPFAVLGFRIDEPTALRILSYTNYHPGLIQIFCAELLKELYRKPRQESLPYTVEAREVENIYLKHDVRSAIRERFTWTLALDMRYQAVAWAMIEDQLTVHDSYAREYGISQIRELVERWWREGFAETEMRVLLDEMKGLGILVEQGGRYRLRSPNLVRLMGEENVEQQLLELSERPAQRRSLNIDHHHRLLDKDKELYSPLTLAQERLLNMDRSGVALLCASTLSGSQRLWTALQCLLPAEQPELKKEARLLLPVMDRINLRRALEHAVNSRSKAEDFVLGYPVSLETSSEVLDELMKEALQWIGKERVAKEKHIRLIFILDPAGLWRWLSLSSAKRERHERDLRAIVTTQPWSDIGLQQWLNRQEALTKPRVILQATGGWYEMVQHAFEDELIPAFKSRQNPSRLRLDQTLDEDAEFRLNWRNMLDLDRLPFVDQLLAGLSQEEQWPSELIAEYFGDPQHVQADYDQALALLGMLHYARSDENSHYWTVDPLIRRLYR